MNVQSKIIIIKQYIIKRISLYFSLIIIAFLSFVFISGCTYEKHKINNKIESKVAKDYTYDDLVWKDYNRIIGLLSIKHGISISLVKPIVLEYLRVNDPSLYFDLTIDHTDKDTTIFDHFIKPIEDVNETIQGLSLKYSIQPYVLSNLLFDFEIWNRMNQIEDDIDNNLSFKIGNELLRDNNN